MRYYIATLTVWSKKLSEPNHSVSLLDRYLDPHT